MKRQFRERVKLLDSPEEEQSIKNMNNIVHAVLELFPYEVVAKASDLLQERHHSVERNITICVSTFLMSLFLRVREDEHILTASSPQVGASDPHFPEAIICELCTEPVSPVDGLVGTYNPLLHQTFGEQLHKLVDFIAGSSGTKSLTTHHLLAAIAPISIGLVQREALVHNMSPAAFLRQQDQAIFEGKDACPEAYALIDPGEGRRCSGPSVLQRPLRRWLQRYQMVLFLFFLLLVSLFVGILMFRVE